MVYTFYIKITKQEKREYGVGLRYAHLARIKQNYTTNTPAATMILIINANIVEI